MKKHYLAACLALGASASAEAASIAVNFSENDGNQGWLDPNAPIGPTDIRAGFFNTTNNPPGAAGLPARTGSLAAGTINGLVDSNGSATAASVTWNSSNVWWNSDGTANDEQRLAVGYLDDGGTGISISVSNVPYAAYRVYGLLTSDQGNTYTALDFTVNGTPVLGAPATAYGNMATSLANTGSEWSLLTPAQAGNYWVSGALSGSSLTITAPPRSGDSRGSISGFIIEEVPEPGTASMSLVAALGLLGRRRRA